MIEMTKEQWGKLLLSLGQVPAIDAAMNLNSREAETLHELAMKGLDWQQTGHLRLGNGDRADALDLAMRLGIDPATGEPKLAPTQEEIAAEIAAERRDRLMDDLMHTGE